MNNSESEEEWHCPVALIVGLGIVSFLIKTFFHYRLRKEPGERVGVDGTILLPYISWRCSKSGTRFLPVYLSIVAVAKNEGLYLAEWIEYHLLVGGEKFELVLNDNEDNSSEVLEPYVSKGIVRLSRWNGPAPQTAIYNFYFRRLRNESFWIALNDIDEFLVPLDGHSVAEILRRFEYFPGVVVNWVVFGTNGQMTRKSGLVMERFRRHTAFDLGINRHTKTVLNPRMTHHCRIHEHAYLNKRLAVNTKGRQMKGVFTDRPPVHCLLRINHYWTKSVEEFRLKRLRGRADFNPDGMTQNMLSVLQAQIDDARDIVADDSAVEWAIPLVKENLAKRYFYRR
jgi:hypothetical protein